MFHYLCLLPFPAVGAPAGEIRSRKKFMDAERHRMRPNVTEQYPALFGPLAPTMKASQGLAMDPIISKLLDELPDKPPRSKLEPHADVISALRRKRHTYREIAEFFREQLSITVSPSTIHDFVRVRRGRRKRNVGSAQDGVPSDPKALHRPKATENPSAADEGARQRIAALKRRTPAEEPQPLFKYEEDEPLKLHRKPPSAKTD
jgi:hypothetical protein